MGIDFPSDVEDLNSTDFDILRCLYDSKALWKMEITRQVNRERSEDMLIDRSDSITKQAVSRRVERLYKLGYLESSIIHLGSTEVEKKPDRDFIEGYKVSDKGEKVLERSIKLILRDTLSELITSENERFSSNIKDFLQLYSNLTDNETESLTDFIRLETDRN